MHASKIAFVGWPTYVRSFRDSTGFNTRLCHTRIADVNFRPVLLKRHVYDVEGRSTLRVTGSPSLFSLPSAPDFPLLPLAKDYAPVPASVDFSTECAVHCVLPQCAGGTRGSTLLWHRQFLVVWNPDVPRLFHMLDSQLNMSHVVRESTVV